MCHHRGLARSEALLPGELKTARVAHHVLSSGAESRKRFCYMGPLGNFACVFGFRTDSSFDREVVTGKSCWVPSGGKKLREKSFRPATPHVELREMEPSRSGGLRVRKNLPGTGNCCFSYPVGRAGAVGTIWSAAPACEGAASVARAICPGPFCQSIERGIIPEGSAGVGQAGKAILRKCWLHRFAKKVRTNGHRSAKGTHRPGRKSESGI